MRHIQENKSRSSRSTKKHGKPNALNRTSSDPCACQKDRFRESSHSQKLTDYGSHWVDGVPQVWPTNSTIWLFNSHGKSPFLIGKPSINGPFSMAMLNNQRVPVLCVHSIRRRIIQLHPRRHQIKPSLSQDRGSHIKLNTSNLYKCPWTQMPVCQNLVPL